MTETFGSEYLLTLEPENTIICPCGKGKLDKREFKTEPSGVYC